LWTRKKRGLRKRRSATRRSGKGLRTPGRAAPPPFCLRRAAGFRADPCAGPAPAYPQLSPASTGAAILGFGPAPRLLGAPASPALDPVSESTPATSAWRLAAGLQLRPPRPAPWTSWEMMEVLPPGSGRPPLLASSPRRMPSRTRSERRKRGWTLRGIGGGPDIGLAGILLGLGVAGLAAAALAVVSVVCAAARPLRSSAARRHRLDNLRQEKER
jgi:hypothetical protein